MTNEKPAQMSNQIQMIKCQITPRWKIFAGAGLPARSIGLANPKNRRTDPEDRSGRKILCFG
jgi:hypothetical protein